MVATAASFYESLYAWNDDAHRDRQDIQSAYSCRPTYDYMWKERLM